jgi:inner membrane protein
MTYKTHLNGGILAGLYIIGSKTLNVPTISAAIFLGGAVVGSIFPDIDHKSSYIGRKTKSISKAINKLAGHRKLFHAPLIYLMLYSISIGSSLPELILIGIKGLFLGILSHLILDSFTVGGLPWFYPLSKKRFSLVNIKTKSKLEEIFCGILLFTNVIILLDIFKITSIFRFTQNFR